MNKIVMPAHLIATARTQGGVFTTKQAAAAGITRAVTQRFLDDHVWWSLARGLYSLSPDPPWDGLAWGGVLLGGPDAALGFEAAGHKLGMCAPPSTIDVLTPHQRINRGSWRFHRMPGIEASGEPPVARIEQTALRMCADAEPEALFSQLARAVTSRRTTPRRLLDAALATPNVRHRALIIEALGDIAGGVHSALERRYFRDVEQRHGLPDGVRQVSLQPSRYSDVAYVEVAVVIELDGRLGHSGDGVFRDFERDNKNSIRGYVTLRFGWNDIVNHPCKVARAVAQLLVSRGWSGMMTPCRGCPDGQAE
ncbi:type IV toxin-antitoxin system AbiEi family antitoxin domain-containing protein [Tessaracoccus sp. ZS01]|uniref:type IV toxin-antitoxin system AbiEi family antitoxin domain-containing protein n=1 Tax=Tessaracoccus sp. ZS01 TaxID=1906324 RepID=UPI00096EE99B|nr:type IV toxin-antitoxin system AbiEi family antitoxin domain-containing protein [Tessaracoccus sp. ZS01]MCG6568729.1 hypothetical protein [Tessaracoccus sp. ZS01]OMG51927.1 hypothetical protein BJN44_14010 [Tessaracoccus sp. ZS01]